MSVRHITMLFEDPYFGQADKAKLLVALAIADHADKEGNAWPGVERIAKKARTSIRGVQTALKSLSEDGKIIVEISKGPSGTNRYSIVDPRNHCTPATIAPRNEAAVKAAEEPAVKAAAGCGGIIINHQEPSGTPHEPPLPAAKKSPQKPRAARSASERGTAFAEWFKTLLPAGMKLEAGHIEAWGQMYDEMIRLDGRTDTEIGKVCQWARMDEFWADNFLSPTKLRKKNNDGVMYFDVFKTKMNGSNGSHLSAGAKLKAERSRGLCPENIKVPVTIYSDED